MLSSVSKVIAFSFPRWCIQKSEQPQQEKIQSCCSAGSAFSSSTTSFTVFPRTEIAILSATKDIINNFPFFFLSINIITFIFMKIKKALLIWCFTNFFRVARDTEMTMPFGCGGRFEPPAFIYKMLSKMDFASTDFVSHFSQFSAFGICVLRIGLYLRIYSPSFSPISASLSAYRRLLA